MAQSPPPTLNVNFSLSLSGGETSEGVVLLGSAESGKSGLFMRFVTGTFQTISDNSKPIESEVKEVNIGDRSVKLNIWDIPPNKFESELSGLLSSSSAFVICIDVKIAESIKTGIEWAKILHEKRSNEAFIVIALTKMESGKEVEATVEREIIGTKLPVFKTSAMTGENVDEVFEEIGKELARRKALHDATKWKTAKRDPLSPKSSRVVSGMRQLATKLFHIQGHSGLFIVPHKAKANGQKQAHLWEIGQLSANLIVIRSHESGLFLSRSIKMLDDKHTHDAKELIWEMHVLEADVVSLKNCDGKYLKIKPNGSVKSKSDSIGPNEHIKLVERPSLVMAMFLPEFIVLASDDKRMEIESVGDYYDDPHFVAAFNFTTTDTSLKKHASDSQMRISGCLVLFDNRLLIALNGKVDKELNYAMIWLFKVTDESATTVTNQLHIASPLRKLVVQFSDESNKQAFENECQKQIDRTLNESKNVTADGSRYFAVEYDDGSSFDGHWKNCRWLKGVHISANGELYVGSFSGGNREGRGMCKYADKSVYEGDWFENLQEGIGKLHYPENNPLGINRYEGKFKSGEPQGDGTVYFNDQSVMHAFWRSSGPAFPATVEHSNGDRYVGEVNSEYKRHGFGIEVSQGKRYYGFWDCGIRSGKGYLWNNSNIEFYGEWKDGVIQGSGFASIEANTRGWYLQGRFSGELGDLQVESGRLIQVPELQINERTPELFVSWLSFHGFRWQGFFESRTLISQVPTRDNFRSVLNKFVMCFSQLYASAKSDQLYNAIEDIYSFTHALARSFTPDRSLSDDLNLFELIDSVVAQIYETIHSLFALKYSQTDEQIEVRVKGIREWPVSRKLSQLGVSHKLIDKLAEQIDLEQINLTFEDGYQADSTLSSELSTDSSNQTSLQQEEDENRPLSSSIALLRRLAASHKPSEKMKLIGMVNEWVAKVVKKVEKSFGADELLPMYAFVLMESGVKQLTTEFRMIEVFFDWNKQNGAEGYALIQSLTAIDVISQPLQGTNPQ